jgi:hypothetical protein
MDRITNAPATTGYAHPSSVAAAPMSPVDAAVDRLREISHELSSAVASTDETFSKVLMPRPSNATESDPARCGPACELAGRLNQIADHYEQLVEQLRSINRASAL